MNDQQLAEYKAGQRQGTQDFFEGPHKRFCEANGTFACGYIQGYDLAEAETDHKNNQKEF